MAPRLRTRQITMDGARSKLYYTLREYHLLSYPGGCRQHRAKLKYLVAIESSNSSTRSSGLDGKFGLWSYFLLFIFQMKAL